MPDLGLTKAIRAAVRTGAKGAKVLRPAEEELIARQAAKAPAPVVPEPQLKPAVVEPTIDVPGAATEEVIPPPQAPGAPRLAPVEPAPVINQAQVASDVFGFEHASLGDFKLDESYQPNFDTMVTTDDVKAVIARQAQQNAAKITAARRDVITNEQLKGLAGDLDVSEDVIKKVLERESGGVLNPETILSARQMLISSATRIKTLSSKIAKGEATDLDKVQFARQIQFHNEYQAQFMGARAEAGRSLNAFKIPVGGDAMQIARISEILQGAGNIDAIARAVNKADSVVGVTKVVRPGLFTRAHKAGQGFINHVFVNGILSSPVTHVVNTGGNVLFQAMNTAEVALAARLGRFLPGAEHVEAGEALASLHGSLSATRDAWRLALKALKDGETLDDVVRYDANAPKGGITGQLPGLDTPLLGRVVRGIEAGIGVPTRLLGAEDDFFKMIAYRGYMERQTLKHVQEQIASGELAMANAAQAARQIMENPTPEIQVAAEDWARQMTFQSPLGPTGQKAQLFLRSVPVLTLIAPFIRTPVNIFKEGVARSPLALFSARFWNAVRRGGQDRDLALTRFAMGSATSAYIAHQVAQGNVTGAGPQQPEAKQLWEGRRPDGSALHQPYSIKVGDTWHSYARMEPIASVIGATADFVEIQSHLADDPEVALNDDQEAYKAAGSIIAAIMNNTGNKTFMKGIADFVELTNDPTRNIVSWTNQMGASMVPYSAALRSIRNVEDPYLREAWTVLDKIKDNTPGYSKDLPPRLGLFGEPREKNSGSILGAMSPLPESKQKHDPVVKELVDVMQKTRLVPATMPGKNIDGMRLTAKEYTDYVRIARSEPIIGGDHTYYDELLRTIETEAYQDATSQGRYEMLKAVQNMADALARAPDGPLENQNPEYAERITNWRIEQDRLRYGEQ